MKNIGIKIKKCLKLNLVLFFVLGVFTFFIINGTLLKDSSMKLLEAVPGAEEDASEEDAKKSEEDAVKSEEDAVKSEEDAKKSEEDAKKSEEDAKKSEEDAKKSEKDAKKSEAEVDKNKDLVLYIAVPVVSVILLIVIGYFVFKTIKSKKNNK